MTKRWKPSVTVAAIIERDGRYLLICSRGKRSLATCLTLRDRGVKDVYSLRGGAQGLI